MPHKIGFKVIFASGEDENHRARELECHGPTVRGWQSSRHCSYPQEIVLRLDSKAVIQRVQILTHQYLIPERVEFFVGNDEGDEAGEVDKKGREEDGAAMEPPEGGPRTITPHHHHHQPNFTHLGYVPLSSNEATGFKARELKSVSVSCTGRYLRLLLHANHQNALNTWNQVGLVAVNLLGEEPEDNNNSHHAEEMGKRERAGSREDEREPVVNGDEADRAIRNNCHTSSSQSSSSTSPFASPSPLSSLLFAASRCGGGGAAGAHGNINENLPRLINSRNYTSPYDDLAFEMYVDTEVATIIRHMEIKKREAVEGERFEYARKLKLAMDELRSAGERLGRWALEKRKAADAEDFERARRKKLQMEEFRAHIYNSYKVAQLLEIHGPLPQNDDPDDPVAGAITMEQLGVPNSVPRHSIRAPLSPSRQQLHPGGHVYQNANCRQHQVQHRQCAACSSHNKDPSPKGNSASTSSHVLSHSPPPAHLPPPSLSPPLGPQGKGCTSPIGSPPSNQRTGLRGSQKKKKPTVSPTATNGSSSVKNSYEAYDERTLPALRHKSYVEDAAAIDDWTTLGEGGSFRLSDREKRQATLPIAVFGLTLVEKFYSKQFTEREEGLQMLREELLKSSKVRQERVSANKTARAAVFLLHRALKDKVFGVYSLSTEVIRFFFSQFVPSKRVSPGEVSKSVERLLPELLSKSGDCAPRVHNLAMNTIIRMSECKDVREQHLIPMNITKPLTSSTHPRLALSRAEMAEQLILRHGISTEKQSGLTCRVLSELGYSGLHHPSEAVRKASERILIQVYQVNPRVVRKQLPPEDDLTRRNLLYRHLFQEFERIDIQRKKDMLQKSKAAAGASATSRMPSGGNSATSGEMTTSVDTISYPSPAHTVSSSSSTSSSSIMTSPAGACSGHMPLDTQAKSKSQSQGAWQSRQHLSPVPDATSEDRMCVFCLERNKAFSAEEGLNLHYWRNCPMLTRCSHCRQVIEVSALSAHLIGECDAQQMYKQCSRCKLAIPVEKYEEHMKALTCTDGESMVCPLCYRSIQPIGEDGWRAHLKGPGPGHCTSQSRRRHGRGGSKSPSDPKSTTSKSTPSNPPPSVNT
ncbi:centrosomal protein of 104 kDa [Hetaerina americana]|uniref:centrosomal protein of 104 kDa n=1 Tax=Hetaerina americana TaxID=62018 RepID=UPI003A7F27DA